MYKSKGDGLLELTISMLIYAAVPTIVVLSGGSGSPVLFAAFYLGAGALATGVYMLLKRPSFFNRDNLSLFIATFVGKDKFEDSPSMLNVLKERSFLIPFGVLNPLLFAWALLYVPDVVASVILESWPIFFIFLLKRGDESYTITARSYLLFVIAFFAVALVIISDVQDSTGATSPVLQYAFGILLILLSMLFYLQGANRFLQSIKLAPSIQWDASNTKRDESSSEIEVSDVSLFLRLLSLGVSAFICFFLFFLFKTFQWFQDFNGSLTLQGIIVATLGGVLVTLFGAIAFARGTIKGSNLKVQAVGYLTPVVSVLLLIVFSPLQSSITGGELVKGIGDIDWLLFLIGCVVVLSITVIINFTEKEKAE